MPRTGIEPVTRGFSVLCSTNWAIWAYTLLSVSSGGRIWTYDLRVMSPTSFQTAPPRDIWFNIEKELNNISFTQMIQLLNSKWMEKDSNLRRRCQQIYSLPPLATRESIHKADKRTRTVNLLITNQLLCQLSHIGIFLMGPTGLEPVTPCL